MREIQLYLNRVNIIITMKPGLLGGEPLYYPKLHFFWLVVGLTSDTTAVSYLIIDTLIIATNYNLF